MAVGNGHQGIVISFGDDFRHVDGVIRTDALTGGRQTCQFARDHIDPAAARRLVRKTESTRIGRPGLEHDGVSELRLVERRLQIAAGGNSQGLAARCDITGVECLWRDRQRCGQSSLLRERSCCECCKQLCGKFRGPGRNAQHRTRHSNLQYAWVCRCCQATAAARMRILRREWRVFQAVACWLRLCRSRAREASVSHRCTFVWHPVHRLLRRHNPTVSGSCNLIVHGARRNWGALATRLPDMSLDELRVRAIQAVRVYMERVADRFSHTRSAEAWPPGRHSALNRGLEFLLDPGSDPALIAQAIMTLDPEVRAAFIRQSDDAQQGLVALLGHEPLYVGNPPNWHREASS